MVDYYKVLELQRSASQDDIKKSYHRLALKWHPDKNLANKEEAEKKFKAVTEAYKILSDPKKRSDYDRSIKETRSHIGRSAKGDHNNCFDIAYVFRDPKDIFKEAFGGTDLFNNIRNNGRGSSSSLFSGLMQSFMPFTSFSHNGQTFYSFTEETSMPCSFRSVLTSTEVINGKRITTRKINENGQEKIEIEEDGRLRSVSINGKEHLKL
ncbi:dnaJ homolog subfamily B member 8 [Coturnix japonica]|uniref:dnaJ homolog subfamily B member 8 n=1 Tax=Coturnix japonica TaxID=93934 RepID=UPI0007774260|nr:dnaJ homolog subfamily B member 8 [Coturnix japonica]